jgi:opacity protein-like surface antigen
MLTVALMIALAWGVAAADESAPQTDDPDDDGFLRYVYLTGGVAPMHYDRGEFNDQIETAGLDKLTLPVGARLGYGFDLGRRPSLFRFSMTFTISNQDRHHDGEFAGLTLAYTDLAFGWKYQVVHWFGVHADAGFAVGNWRYVLIADNADGQANGALFGATPRAGVIFDVTETLGFDLFGGYTAFFANGARLFSGDLRRRDFEDHDFSHMIWGLQVISRIF